MNVKNCKRCGKIFNYVVGPVICPQCQEERENKFQEVKKYVRDNPGVDIIQVSEECDVDTNQIRQWIREERLQFADDSPIKIACEGCGAMIGSGRFCDKCKANLNKEIKNMINPITENKKPVASHSARSKIRYL